jgi:RimJ/RimL family protein N-acetyltransferase
VAASSLVTLRAFGPDDAERYRQWINEPDIGALIDRGHPISAAEHARWYQDLVAAETNRVLAIDDQAGRFIGLVWLYGIHPRHRRAEVRIVIGERTAWGGGRGADALRQVAAMAFGPLGLEKLWADVLATNPRAAAAFEKAGFVREGLLRGDRAAADGARVDVIRLGLLRSDLPVVAPADRPR